MAKSPHTMIRVLDEARSVAVYKAGLDLKRADRCEFNSFIFVDRRGEDSPFERELTINHGRKEPCGRGEPYGHIAVAVDDLDREHARLAPASRAPEPIKEVPSPWCADGAVVFFPDPEGRRIEVLQRCGHNG